jgi:hypothetical protein
MSDYDRNQRIPGYNRPTRGWSSGSWVAGIIIAILVIVAVGYAFSDRWTGAGGMTEHRASTTDTAPSTSPAAPAHSASPEAAPKP